MKKHSQLWVALSCLAMTVVGAWAQDAAPSMEVDTAAAAKYDFTAVRTLLKGAVDNNTVPCASLLLIHKDKVIFKEAFGWADIENKKPLTVDSMCHLASSTKWLTGTALIAAVEDGYVALDDPVGKYYPVMKDMPIKDSQEKGNPTLRQCFSHSAGFEVACPALRDSTLTFQECVARIPTELPQLRQSREDIR